MKDIQMYVPVDRTINGHPLVGDIELTLADITGNKLALQVTEIGTVLTGLNAVIIQSNANTVKLATVETGATVGATWGTNLASIPAFLAATAPDNSLALTGTFMGFHATGSNWPIKIANESGVGKFYAGNGSDKYMSWDGTDLVVQGTIKTKASGKRIEISNTDNEIHFYETGGEIVKIGSDLQGLDIPGIKISQGQIYLVNSTIGNMYPIEILSSAGNPNGIHIYCSGTLGTGIYVNMEDSASYSFYGNGGKFYNAGTINGYTLGSACAASTSDFAPAAQGAVYGSRIASGFWVAGSNGGPTAVQIYAYPIVVNGVTHYCME